MTDLRRILVPIDGTEAARPALDAAFAVATACGAHLHALHVGGEPTSAVPLVGEGMSGALIHDLVELAQRQADERAAAARAMFDEVRTANGVPLQDAPPAPAPARHDGAPGPAGASASFTARTGREDEAVVADGRLSDLVVVARPGSEAEGSSGLAFHAALFATGGPVLVAAGDAKAGPRAGGFPGRVVVAWSDACEAARALRFALPVLARAGRVDTVAVDDDGNAGGAAGHSRGVSGGGAAAVADYLAWHGIAAGRRQIAGEGRTGEALARACADADLVVMGAYTHSRLRQLILGSVTRHMLDETAMQLLMAH